MRPVRLIEPMENRASTKEFETINERIQGGSNVSLYDKTGAKVTTYHGVEIRFTKIKNELIRQSNPDPENLLQLVFKINKDAFLLPRLPQEKHFRLPGPAARAWAAQIAIDCKDKNMADQEEHPSPHFGHVATQNSYVLVTRRQTSVSKAEWHVWSNSRSNVSPKSAYNVLLKLRAGELTHKFDYAASFKSQGETYIEKKSQADGESYTPPEKVDEEAEAFGETSVEDGEESPAQEPEFEGEVHYLARLCRANRLRKFRRYTEGMQVEITRLPEEEGTTVTSEQLACINSLTIFETLHRDGPQTIFQAIERISYRKLEFNTRVGKQFYFRFHRELKNAVPIFERHGAREIAFEPGSKMGHCRSTRSKRIAWNFPANSVQNIRSDLEEIS